jgi:hypothetical protein
MLTNESSSRILLHIKFIFKWYHSLRLYIMGRRKDASSTHAMPSTEKKKRKAMQVEPVEKKAKANNGPSGWEEIEAVEAPRNVQGKCDLF